MPKRGGPRPGKNWGNYNDRRFDNNFENPGRFGEHGDRSSDKRRVSFKTHRGGKGKQTRDWEQGIRHQLQEDDIDMSSFSGGGGGRVRQMHNDRRRRSPLPNNKGGPPQKRILQQGPSNWYKVRIVQGQRYGKELIISTLSNFIGETITPIALYTDERDVFFFVDDFKIATKINNASHKLTMQGNNYNKLFIQVRYNMPQMEINDDLKERMKRAMMGRYNAETKALDLTKFHYDPNVVDVFCALFRPALMIIAIDVIAENVPDLEALSLQENKLQSLDHLSILAKKLPNLKILHIGNNNIRDIRLLEALKGLQLVDLVLDGNPLCDKLQDKSLYISEVRKRFPKVIKLDGVDLPPPIVFDIEDQGSLPASQMRFWCSVDGQQIVQQFLEHYFIIYDSDNRQPLLEAYHENAMFSLTSTLNRFNHNKAPAHWSVDSNRNLLAKGMSVDRRNKLVKIGQIQIVSFLTEIPKTEHDKRTFTVDQTVYLPQFFQVTVSGLFKERNVISKTPPTLSFSRTMIIMPYGTGFCIINETLTITNATKEQAKTAFQPVEVKLPVSPPMAPVVPPPIDDQTKQQMAQVVAQQTGMNLEWSALCLKESNWDLQRAVAAFTESHSQGRVPPDAFVK